MKAKILDDDSYIRRLLSFVCFSEKVDFEKVKNAFSNWVEGAKPLKERNREIIQISKELENIKPEKEDFLWYKTDLNRFAGIIILYFMSGFYKTKPGKKDKHAKLLIDLMKNISEGSFPDKAILDEINLTYYWHDEAMGYFVKVHELMKMDVEKFKSLPDLEIWLNS